MNALCCGFVPSLTCRRREKWDRDRAEDVWTLALS
jgi:hypothetical protein